MTTELLDIDVGYDQLKAEIAKIEDDQTRIQRETTELIEMHLNAGVHPDVVLSALLNALQAFRG